MDDDAQLVETCAHQWLRKLGRDAPGYLRQRMRSAGEAGDTLSAKAWRDIAENVELLLDRHGIRIL